MHTATFWLKFMIDIEKLIEIVNTKLASGKYKVTRLALTKIDLHGLDQNNRTGFGKKRYRFADIKYPLLVYKESSRYLLVDGRHRYFKLIEKNRKFANIILIAEKDLAQCEIKEE